MTGKQPGHPLARLLLEWYAHNERDLPWRRTRDPYRIAVSEFMLHQTQVTRVLLYYDRFVQRFPDWAALASAPLDEVLKAWESMGYYARARNLHALAQRVCAQHGGQLPRSQAELMALPGIGEYTAGAILSIAFGQAVPAVDGNARRVLSRAFQVTEDPLSREGQQRLQTIARSLLPADLAGTFNQALMDLGSTVCTPRSPECPACPWHDDCRARQLGIQESLPVRRPRKPLPHHDIAAGVIWRDGQILIARRPPRGLLGGLWEFPGGKLEPGETLEQCLVREVREELGIEVHVGELLTTVQHAYTHFRITLHAFHCCYLSGEPQAIGCTAWEWVSVEQLDGYAFPAANHRIIAALRPPGGP